MRKKGRKAAEGGQINMTPMIDIVFQMIIFFVCTVELERKAVNERIRLAMAPHGPAEEKKDPRTILVDVDDKGRISINRTQLPLPVFNAVIRKAVAETGQTTPVVIRGDIDTRHEHIRKVMDICSSAGLWKIRFAAIKDRAVKGP